MHPSVSSLVENRRPTGTSPPVSIGASSLSSSAIPTWGSAVAAKPAAAVMAVPSPGSNRGTGTSSASVVSSGSNTVVPGEIKPQKACQSCRRSKVRCVHDGQPPCKRCADQKLECKFRLRADDELWRERTDEQLSRLSSDVENLYRQIGPATTSQPNPIQYAPRSSSGGRSHSASAYYSGSSAPSLPMPPSPSFANGGSNAYRPVLPPLSSPYSEPMPDHNSPSASFSSDTPMPRDRASPMMSRKRPAPVDFGMESHRSPSSSVSTGAVNEASSSSRASMLPPPLPAATRMNRWDTSQIDISPSLADACALASSSWSSTYYLQPQQQQQSQPSASRKPEWTRGSTSHYASASLHIGRDDPRINVVTANLVSMKAARSLMRFFAERLLPHSMGFPTFPANEQMTPLIVSAILSVASLHDPVLRTLHSELKTDCISQLDPNHDVDDFANRQLDPELGVGVEEITSACIAAAWLGGEVSWHFARVARWWSVDYLRHFEVREQPTQHESWSVHPPFRLIDNVDKARIWLAGFVAEAQQSFILNRACLIPESPSRHIESLRHAFSSSSDESSPAITARTSPSGGISGLLKPKTEKKKLGAATGGSECSWNGPIRVPPSSDRQLLGHAGLLFILIRAQDMQRGQSHLQSRSPGQGAFEQTRDTWSSYLDELELWRADTNVLEDLSQPSPSALDLSLSYHLTKAYIASLAFDAESRSSPNYHQQMTPSPPSRMLLRGQHQTIEAGSASALSAINLVTDPLAFRDRITYLPNWYHHMLGHAAGFLLQLCQRKGAHLLAGEARGYLAAVESLSQAYNVGFANHFFQTEAIDCPHPSQATADALYKACAQTRSHLRAAM